MTQSTQSTEIERLLQLWEQAHHSWERLQRIRAKNAMMNEILR